jgi:hypothetical protein
MAATVFGTPRYGVVNDTTLTGLAVGSYTASLETEQAFAKNHLGNDVAMSIFNDSQTITLSGVVAVLATGLVPSLAAAVTLANGTQSAKLFTTPDAGANFVVTGASLTRANTEFETGEISGVYKPLIGVGSPTVLTD